MAEKEVAPAGAAEGVVVMVTMEMVGEAIVAALMGFLKFPGLIALVAELTKDLVTQEQLAAAGALTLTQVQGLIDDAAGKLVSADLLKEALASFKGGVPFVPVPEDTPVLKDPIDAKYLKGLTYRTSKPRKGGAGDDDSTVHVPVERDLTPADVLDWTERDGKICFVTGDGKSLSVPK